MNVQNKYLNAIFLLGDHSRFDYAEKFIEKNQMVDYEHAKNNLDSNFIVIVSEFYRNHPEALIKIENQFLNKDDKSRSRFYFTKNIPFATCFVLPALNNVYEIEKDINCKWASKVIIFDVFPYCEEEIRILAESIIEKMPYIDLRIFLMETIRRFGYTDMTDLNRTLAEANEIYNDIKQGLVIGLAELERSIYSTDTDISIACSHGLRENLKKVKNRLDNFDSDYEVMLIISDDELTSIEKLNQLCNYDGVKHSKNVGEGFVNNAIKEYFGKSDFIESLIALYHEIISPICIWDSQKYEVLLIEHLKSSLKKGAQKRLSKIYDNKVPDSELKYRSLMAEDNSDVIFKKFICEEYFEKFLPDTVKKFIEVKHNTICNLYGGE